MWLWVILKCRLFLVFLRWRSRYNWSDDHVGWRGSDVELELKLV